MCRASLRAGSGWCSSSSSSSSSGSGSGSGIATNHPGLKSWRGRSWVPFVPPLSHSRKLYRSATTTAAATTVPATPPSASASLGSFYNSSNSFTFTLPTLPSTCSSTLSPTTKLSSRLRLQTTSRRTFFAISPKHFYSKHAPSSRVPLPIMYEGKWTAPTVRQTFFDYFAERGHTIGTIQPQRSHLTCARSRL